MFKTLFKFWVAAAVVGSAQREPAKQQVVALQHVDSANALGTTNALDYLTTVDVAQQCIPAIAGIATTNIQNQLDLFDPALLSNSKINPKIYKKIKKCVVEATEEQIQILSEIITTLVNYSPEHRAYIELALTDDHPLYVLFSPFGNKGVQAIYAQVTNSIVLSTNIMPNQKGIEEVAHELRHRLWHVVHTRLSARISLEVYPFYPTSEQVWQAHKANLELGNQRILIELKALFLAEQAGEILSLEQSNYLERIRTLLDNNGMPLTHICDNSPLLTKNQLNWLRKSGFELNGLKLFHNKHFIISSSEITETGLYKVCILVIDPVAVILSELYMVLKLAKNNHDFETDAYLWQCLPVSVLKEFFPKYLEDTQLLIEYASKFPNKITYENQPQSVPEIKAIGEKIIRDLRLITSQNAQIAFYTALAYLQNDFFIAEKIFEALIDKGFFRAESLTELANVSGKQNKFKRVYEYFKQAEQTFQQSSRAIGFTLFEWEHYAHASFKAGDYHKTEKILEHLIETDFSEENKKDYRERLEILRKMIPVSNSDNSASQPSAASPRP